MNQPIPSSFQHPGHIAPIMFAANGSPIVVNGGNFTMINRISGQESALDRLTKNTSMSATHASGDIPRCHLNTRQAVVAKLAEWARNPEGTPVLWLFGHKDSGKTSTGSSFADFLQAEGYVSVASYFICRGNEGNRPDLVYYSTKSLVPTVAFQLGNTVPGLMPHILSSIEANPSVFEQPVEIQLRKLIVEPILVSKIDQRSVVVIDGLDKCDNQAALGRLFDILPAVISSLSGKVKFLFLSLSEQDIVETSRLPAINAISTVLDLKDEVDDPRDIRTYMVDSVHRLRLNTRYASGAQSTFPLPDDTEGLVDMLMAYKLLHSFSAAHDMVHSLDFLCSLHIKAHAVLTNAELCTVILACASPVDSRLFFF